ncbi:phage tail protein [Novispirillum itersonii]|uniref:phage tail protein n=1 Tax=Novispirillum itersonii TaxID=189 RepID=UPI0003829ED9|nr:tail fiber protein [Novispirillum itersonii]
MSEPFIGQITYFPFSRAIVGWLICSGSEFSVNEYPALYSLIGNKYGGDGVKTFRIPNLTGTVPVGIGQVPDGYIQWRLGMAKGEDEVLLDTEFHAPVHDHKVYFAGTPSTTGTATAGSMLASVAPPQFWAAPKNKMNTNLHKSSLGNAYSEKPKAHENRQPYLALTPMIAHQGIYPPFPG